jgi:O-antigen/teichoic acid export membrane protein
VLYAVYVKRTPVPVWAWADLKPILAFSLVGHLSNVVNLINYRFDVWVVEEYRDTAQLGLYATAVGVAQLLFYVPEPFSRVVQPYLFGQVKDEMVSRFKAVARLNFTALLVLAAGLAALAHWVLPLLYGEEFAPSAGPLRMLLPGIVFMGAAKLLTQLVVQGGLQRFNLLATSLAAVLTITLDLLLIPRWGIHGAAVATSIAYAVTLLTLLYTIRWRMGVPVHDLFLLRPSDLSYLRQRTS